MKLGKVLLVAAAGVGLLAFAAPANAQMRGRGGVAGAAWHGHGGGWHGHGWHGHGWGWRGYPGWGWRGNIAFGFYGYPYWGYPYGYPYGYYAYPPPPYYAGYAGQQRVYDGHVVQRHRDAKDVSSDE